MLALPKFLLLLLRHHAPLCLNRLGIFLHLLFIPLLMKTGLQIFLTENKYNAFLSDQNECDNQPCHSNATCNNTEGSYKCTCMLSYTGDGETCTWYKGNVILLESSVKRVE